MPADTLAPPPAEPAEGKLPAQPARPAAATQNWMSGLGEFGAPQAPAPDSEAESHRDSAPAATPAAGNAKPAADATKDATQGKPAAPVVDPSPEEDKWPRSAVEWKKFRESRKEKETKLEETIKERDARIAALEKEKVNGTSAELESLKKLNSELSKRIQLLDVTQEPRFEAYFANKTNAQLELAKRIVGADLSSRVEAALKVPDSPWRQLEIETIYEHLRPAQQARLGGVLNSLESIAAERQSEIDQAQSNSAALKAQREQAAKAQADRLEAMITQTIAAAADPKDGIAPYQKRENDSTWNNAVDARITHARNILSGKGLQPKDIVQSAFYAAAIPAILQDNLNLRGQIEKLEAQVKSLSSATPKLEAASPSANGADPTGSAAAQAIKPGTRPMDISRGWAESIAKAMSGGE